MAASLPSAGGGAGGAGGASAGGAGGAGGVVGAGGAIAPAQPDQRRRRRWVLAATAMAVLGVVHALVVSVRYHVGSFDDDGSYVSAARAIASGHGMTSRLAGGAPLVGVYPPGYPALLAPLALIWRDGVLDFRIESLVFFAAIFPLTWVYLGRRGVPDPLRVAVLALLALNPVLATYATMVMAEVPFVVVLMLMLLAAERWESEAQMVTWSGVVTVVCAAELVWMKEAGVGLAIGLVAWFFWRRLWRKACWAAVASAALLLPLLVIRLVVGANVIGSRYSKDLGGVLHGGLVGRVYPVVPDAAWTYVRSALPDTLLPTGMGVLVHHGWISHLFVAIALLSAPLVIVGFVVWCRGHADAACLVVPVYLAETLVYPYTNQRRVVLVLPVIVAWYALGAATAFHALRLAARRVGAHFDHGPGRVGSRAGAAIGVALPVLVCLLAVVELVGQFPRDYLYNLWTGSSAPGGSGYMAMLHQLGKSSDVLETDYLWTTALYTGHQTANGVYEVACQTPLVKGALASDDAGFVLTSSINGGGLIDDSCLLPIISGLPGAVRLYRSAHDQSSVFELVGPGTGHPGLVDLSASASLDGSQPVTEVEERSQEDGDHPGQYPTLAASDGVATFTWRWAQPVPLTQVSVGAAGAASPGHTTSVQVSMLAPDGTWKVVDTVDGAVGPGAATPFLVVPMTAAGQSELVSAVRVTVGVVGPATVAVHYFHALGASGP